MLTLWLQTHMCTHSDTHMHAHPDAHMHACPHTNMQAHTNTLKPYLITSTTKVNAVKNFNLRSEKEGDIPLTKSTSPQSLKDTKTINKATPGQALFLACSLSVLLWLGKTTNSGAQHSGFRQRTLNLVPCPGQALFMVLIGLWQFSQPCGSRDHWLLL